MAQIGGEEARRFGHMHPGQHPRIGRGVTAAVGKGAADRGMNTIDALDRGGGSVAVSEGGHRDELGCPPQPAVHVLAEVGVVQHALQGMRVQHLQQQRADSADHHAHDIRMDHPDRRIALEQGIG